MRYRAALLALALSLTVAAEGQVVTTRPPQPNTLTPVTIVVTTNCQCPLFDGTIARNGNTFDVTFDPDCAITLCIPVEVTYDVGLLPAGTYTVRQHPIDNPSDISVIGTFNVEAPPIPVNDWRGKTALAVALALASLLALRRVS